mgnify:CR=1 FL=1
MQPVTLACATLNQTPLDWKGNRARIEAAIAEARTAGVQFLCFPELTIPGYGCEDAFLSLSLPRQAMDVLRSLRPLTKDIAVAVGLPVRHENALYNGVALLADGAIAGIVAKQFLAGEGVHYEPRWFRPWPAGRSDRIDVDGQAVPMGDLFFDLRGIRIGFEICEDAWVARRPGIALAENGVDILANPSASHFSFGKHETRKSFVVDASRAFAATCMYANLVGNEAGRIVYDGGAMIASAGQLLAEGRRFRFVDHELLIADVDVELTRMAGARKPSPAGDAVRIRPVPVDAPFMDRPAGRPVRAVTQPVMPKEEEFARAVSLGLFDYLRKSRSRGFVLSLSGGADSAAVAVLIRLMAQWAVRDLGLRGLRDKLPHVPLASERPEDITGALLTCVYQSTRNSGDVTREAAGALARELGAEFFFWDVDELVNRYTKMVEGSLGRRLDWGADDVALQNIQARVRSPGVWMLANVKGALLLSTSNRSEAAVGYATMDGDTSGGLAPIAGIDKAWLLTWLAHMETEGLPEVGNIPVLTAITAQRPTAELRPGASKQTDEDDLMPYTVLSRIEQLAIRDRKDPVTVYERLLADDVAPSAQLKTWVARFFTLWSRNQWKRERYAPSFHLDDRNVDPKTWCRFPILSGGFAEELDELMKR